jgi:predicted lipid carrier protein YhbT
MDLKCSKCGNELTGKEYNLMDDIEVEPCPKCLENVVKQTIDKVTKELEEYLRTQI